MLPLKERFTSNVSTLEIRGTSNSVFEDTSSPSRSKVFSIFDDTACGEPLPAQRLTVDFTPVEGIDTDYVQRKCCAFWDFINSRTDLHHMVVMPEKNLYEVATEPSLPVQKPPEVEVSLKEATAVSMLEFVEGKGLIDRTFEAKLPQSMCSLGSREYLENTSPQRTKKAVCTCKGVCKTCTRLVTAAPDDRSSPEVQFLCEKMKDWDRVHPKSMEPPGHPPALKRCIMQRNVPI